jgi:hypothetical protein
MGKLAILYWDISFVIHTFCLIVGVQFYHNIQTNAMHVTPCSETVAEKLVIVQLVKEFPAF